jgi:outer membrane protein OmpA-like peptidoglycan-associated protein
MLDGFELQNVQIVDGSESEALVQHGIPALEGDFLQDLGRRATRFALEGVVTGAEAGSALKTLREKHRAAAPVSFVEDIATATSVGNVLIEELGIRELAGRPERFEYAISLIEYIAAPKPTDEIPPVRPPKPIDPANGALIVTVIVDDDPSFDMSTVTVTMSGTQADGTAVGPTTLANREENRWTDDPLAPGSYTVSASAPVDDGAMTGSASATVVPSQTAQVEIHLHRGPAVGHAFVVTYWFDKAIVEPCLRRVLRDVVAYAHAHPDEHVVIVGNTDLVGDDGYNQSLSERRARGVYAYLTAGRDHATSVAEWDALRKHSGGLLADNWAVREYQLLLNGLSYYGGQIDEQHGPLTDAAVRNFQKDHGLAVDGIVGNNTWPALIDAYLSADNLTIDEVRFFPNCPGEVVKWLGSGEQDPVRNTEDAWRPNRRTDIVFVRADTLPGKVAPPVTFALPAPGAVNASWCAGKPGDPRVILSRGTQKPNTFLVQPAEPGTVIVKGTMTFEDGSPAAKVSYVLMAPDGEYMDGERPSGDSRGRPIPGTTGADGTFAYPAKPKGVGVYVLTVDGPVTARLKEDAPNSGTSPMLCARLDGSKNLDVVLAPSDGIDPRRKLTATLYGRTFEPLAATTVDITFPDNTTAQATTDADGRFSVVMGDTYATANLRYAASSDASDVVQLDYFVDAGDIATDDGVTKRLHNLGFEPDEGLADAVAGFQGTQGLNPTGQIDDDTRVQLNRVYQGDAPLFPVFDDAPSGDSPDAPPAAP